MKTKRIALAISLLILHFPISLSAENIAARELLNRILGNKSNHFILEDIKYQDANIHKAQADCFEIENSTDNRIIIRGNSANSIAVGLNHYLRFYCKTSVSWFVNDKIKLPETLPAVGEKVHINSTCKNRFFLNYCTFGYTMPWWQWRDWERLIDWMALNGINLPLAITGQESVWFRVWSKLGLSDDTIRGYFTGPAHLPWHRMLNMDYWQGPLPHSWLDGQEALQKQIVKRERDLSMTPVLPAFAGHVPYELKKIYPHAKISKLSKWGGFDSTYVSSFLDPMDPLFKTIQKEFLLEQTKLYGTDHIYGIDPFNEIEPPSWEPVYLARVSKTIYETLTVADPQATWLQMSWLYYYQRKDWTNPRIEAFVKAVPQNKMLLLDYFCEKSEVWKMTDKYFGQPYIWCYLGNFGGNTMLAGDMKEVGKRIENTMKNGGPNFWGIGSTLEGFDCNPHMYEYVFDKAWNFRISDDQWMSAWADRRVCETNGNIRKAWKILYDSIYNNTSRTGHCNMVSARPNLDKQERYAKTGITYNNKLLFHVWELMINSDINPEEAPDAYLFDIVNIGRQVLGNHFDTLWNLYKSVYKERNLIKINQLENKMITILADMDRLLATNSAFLLGKWISDARKMGVTSKEADYYEVNARDLLTSWGAKGQALSDYANRSWSGLISSFYAKRWQLFFDEANLAIKQNREFDNEKFNSIVVDFEGAWWSEKYDSFSSVPKENSVNVAIELLKKYKVEINH